MNNLPSEILSEIFKYFQDDHKTLFSCILVNKLWHNISIPTLWKIVLYSSEGSSIKILINCLLVEDKDFLTNHNIKLEFRLLKRPPLHNYARYITRLDPCFFNSLHIRFQYL